MSEASGNSQQARYWTDIGGPHWVNDHELFDHMLAPFDVESRRLLAAQPGEHVLDIGCGVGTSTAAIAAAVGPTGSVVGCDISSTMIDAARSRLANIAQISLAIADAQTADLLQADPFDAVYSRFGVMFFSDPVAAFANIATSVRPGGRLVFVCWQHEDRNEWISMPASIMRSFTPEPVLPDVDVPGPFSFRDPQRIAEVLGQAGWVDTTITSFSTTVELGGGQGVDAAVRQLMGTRAAQGLREQVDEATYAQAVEALRTALAEHVGPTGAVSFIASAWIVTAHWP